MRNPIVTETEVINYFKKQRIVTWDQLTSYFGISRQALRVKIQDHPHLTSLNNNRRYLTLEKFIGKPNQYGIWTYKGVKFSTHGDTPKTIMHLIYTSDSGMSTKQLEQITSVKCWGILLKLLKQGNIYRIREGFDYIYLSSTPDIRQIQLENRGIASQEPMIEARTQLPSEESSEIYNLLELREDDYLLRRLEIVRRIKSGKSKTKVAEELDCSPVTVRNTCRTFEEKGAKGLVITRKKQAYKMTESTQIEILIMKAKHPDWSPEKIGNTLQERGLDISDRSVRIFLEDVGLISQKKTRDRS